MQMVIQFLILLFFYIKKIHLKCDEGCLSCSGSTCNVCDPTLNYVKLGSSCKKNEIDNCFLTLEDGKCDTC